MNYNDLNDEMREHLNEKIADLVEAGLSESDARAQALRDFGNRTLHLEESRAVWRWPSLDRFSQDLRYAFRGMRRSPGFALVVVATLALGIGANTAIFSLVNQLLLHPPGMLNPERIVSVGTRYNKLSLHMFWVSPPTFADVRDSRNVFEHAALVALGDVNYAAEDNPERLQAAAVSVEFFDVLGVQPWLGRTFRPEEDQPKANRVVILSYAAWTRLFGADRSVVGRPILLDGVAHQIIGVMPPGFRYPQVDVWTPAGLPAELFTANNWFNESLYAVARVRRGVSFDEAKAWLGVLTNRVRSTGPAYAVTSDWGLFAAPVTDLLAGATKTPLLVLAGAVGLVLLIACSNIAGLMLARASARAHEFAVRSALGASSGRLLRVILTESAVLAIAGGLAGLGLAYAAMNLLLLLAPESASAGLRPTLDIHVLGFGAVTVIVSGVLFGIAPAWRISHSDPNEALKSGRASTAEPARQRLRSTLVVAETALALVLLVAAGLFLRSFVQLEGVSPGFQPHGVTAASFSLPGPAYPNGQKQAEFYRAVLERLRNIPGGAAAAMGYPVPFSGDEGSASFAIDGRVQMSGDPGPHGDIRSVTPGYFETLSIPLKSGRFFTDRDRYNTEQVAIIDDVLARRYWPHEDPVGKKISQRKNSYTIIGVVGHVLHSDLAADSGRGTYYFTMFQRPQPVNSILVKATGGEGAGAIREAVRAVDPRQAIYPLRPMEDMVSASLAPRQFAMRLLGFFGAMALFLAALGLYGVISYSVARRTREIGIRVALGASSGSVIGEVVAQGLRLAAIGVGIGIAGSILCGRFLASQLFEVTPFDPLTLSAMAAALLAAAFVASYLPALRAARVDPVTALRQE